MNNFLVRACSCHDRITLREWQNLR